MMFSLFWVSHFKEEVYRNKVHFQIYFSYSETLEEQKDANFNKFTGNSFTELISS